MSTVLLLFIVGMIVFIINNNKKLPKSHHGGIFFSPARKKSWADMTIAERKAQREEEFQQLLKTIRENRAKRERGEYVAVIECPAKRMYDRELSKMFKPNFQNDPEWQRLSKSTRETIERNRRANDRIIADME